MRPRKRSSARAAFVALMTVAGLATVPMTSVQAEIVPPLEFPAVSIGSTIPKAMHAISQSDGAVTIGGCGSQGGNTDSFAQYAATGSNVQSQPLAVNGRTVYTCLNQSAVGNDGAVYTAAWEPSTSQEVLVAFKAGSQQWVYTPPCKYISDVKLGTNGNVYMLVNTGSGCSHPKMVGVEPTLAGGQTSPAVVVNTSVQYSGGYNGSLSPYSDGLIVRLTNGVGFYDYTGAHQATHTMTAGSFDSGPFGTIDGWAIVPMLEQTPRPLNCQNDSQAADAINAYDENGVVWSHELPDCTRVDSIRPMPDGGAVALIQVQDQINWGTYTRKFIGISPATSPNPRWTGAELPPLGTRINGETFLNYSFTTDLNGNLVMQSLFKRRESNLDYFGVYVAVSSGYTGIGFGNVEFYGGQSDGYGLRPPNGVDGIPTIGNGVAYTTLSQCSAYGSCDYSTTKLYAAQVPGLAMDYPRGAVLDYNAPWKNYVALGDSFSSGEGVPDFDPATDTAGPPENRCHRSGKAYSRLLDDSLALRWSMTAFAACSGAVSTNLTDSGQYNEQEQGNTLSQSTDVVTFTIGGNDIGFSDVAYMCIVNQCQTGIALADSGIAYLELSLPNLLQDIRDRVRADTEIFVVGYPQLVPLPSEIESNCEWGTLLGEMSAEEMDELQRVTNELNEVISDAVAEAGNNTNFVDPRTEFDGHELCTEDSYFNYAQIWPHQEYSLHPNHKGQDAYANAIRLAATS